MKSSPYQSVLLSQLNFGWVDPIQWKINATHMQLQLDDLKSNEVIYYHALDCIYFQYIFIAILCI